MIHETRKNIVVMKLKYSMGKCSVCKNNANWIVQVSDCATVSRIPVCDRHRPRKNKNR